jgi:hypothetical protein
LSNSEAGKRVEERIASLRFSVETAHERELVGWRRVFAVVLWLASLVFWVEMFNSE